MWTRWFSLNKHVSAWLPVRVEMAMDSSCYCRSYLFRCMCMHVGAFAVHKIVSSCSLAFGNSGLLVVSIYSTSFTLAHNSATIDKSGVVFLVDGHGHSLP